MTATSHSRRYFKLFRSCSIAEGLDPLRHDSSMDSMTSLDCQAHSANALQKENDVEITALA